MRRPFLLAGGQFHSRHPRRHTRELEIVFTAVRLLRSKCPGSVDRQKHDYDVGRSVLERYLDSKAYPYLSPPWERTRWRGDESRSTWSRAAHRGRRKHARRLWRALAT